MRNKKRATEERTEERPITLEEALNNDKAGTIYERLSGIVQEHGFDIILRVRVIQSDFRNTSFLDELMSRDDLESFISNPKMFLKNKYGEGSYRVDIVDPTSKRFISNLKFDISSPREKINRQPDYLGEVTKAYKEGVSLGKSSLPTPNNQSPFDLT